MGIVGKKETRRVGKSGNEEGKIGGFLAMPKEQK